jgi:MFS family permease
MPPSSDNGSSGTDRDRQILLTALAGAIAMAVAMGLGRFFYTPVLPEMMDGLGLGPSEAGWIASANYAGYLLGAILAAWGWAEGIERKVALSALVATALLLLAMGLASDALVLAAIRFLAGLASAFVMIFTSAIVLSHGLAAAKPWVQSGHFGGVGIGISISALMFAVLVMFDGGWRMAWFLAAGLAFVGLVHGLALPAGRRDAGWPGQKGTAACLDATADRLDRRLRCLRLRIHRHRDLSCCDRA